MPIQLIITGDHITDVFAEITNFAAAIGGEAPKSQAVHEAVARGATTIATQASTPASKSTEAQTSGGKTDAKLSREEQDAAVDEMIAAGSKDARFDLLTKGRQKAVEDGLATSKAEETKPADEALSDMFDDAEEEVVAEVTVATVRELMGKLGKDEKGNPVQDNLIKIREILTKYVPKGIEVKVGNIPEDKIGAVHAEMKKLEV